MENPGIYMKPKYIIIVPILVLLIQAQALAQDRNSDEWTKLDKSLFGLYTAANIIDIFQTRYIHSHDEYKEQNPILKNIGQNGSTLIQIGVNIGLYFAADALPGNYRTTALSISSGLKVGIISNNFLIGVKMEF